MYVLNICTVIDLMIWIKKAHQCYHFSFILCLLDRNASDLVFFESATYHFSWQNDLIPVENYIYSRKNLMDLYFD